MSKNITRKVTLAAIFIALAVILKFFQIQLPGNRISFYNIPLIISGLILGPIYGGITALLTDVVSIIYQPGWSPFFMIPVVFWGVIPGLLRKGFKKLNLLQVTTIEVTTHLIVSVLNTIMLGLTMGFDVALGKVTSSGEIALHFFNYKFVLFSLGSAVYFRLILVGVFMLIKIPLDIIILNVLLKRIKKEQWIWLK